VQFLGVSLLTILLGVIALAGVICAVKLVRAMVVRVAWPRVEAIMVGAITNFFDTLGIGSFAPTMAWLKLRNILPDQIIPCTMLVGHTLPTVAQALIFLALLGVFVDPVLLIGCAAALIAGAFLGAPLVTRTRVWLVQAIVGGALVLAAFLYTMSSLQLLPAGGTAGSLPPSLTIVAIAGNFVFGVLLNFGIGHYAPTLVMFSLMGMDPRLAFPIMAGGGALAATGASFRHIGIGEIDLRIAAGLALGGIPAVLLAAFVVKSMPVEMLRWLVSIVVLYTALVMLRAACLGRRAERLSKVRHRQVDIS